MQLADAENVIGVVMTFVFSLTSSANADKCKAAVPLDTATAYLQPMYSEKAFSNSPIFGHWVKKS